jgi:membrane fusion protein, multidrug efflux system
MRILLISLITLLLLQSCADKSTKAAPVQAQQKQTPTPQWQWTAVQSAQPEFTIILPGELKPYEQVSLYAKMKGFVKKIYVDRGSYVRKGQLLAQLEAPEINAQFAAQQSSTGSAYQQYLFSKQTYYRLKEAAKKNGAVAAVELEKAYARYLGDSATYSSSRSEASASGQLQNYLQIRAPFSGVLTGRFVSEGALVGENGTNSTPLFQLAQQNKLRLTVAVPEKQAQSLPEGTKATFTVVDYPGKTFTAVLSRHSGAVDLSSRSVVAEFDIANPGAELRAGQYAKTTIQLQRRQATLWVPLSSVVESQAGRFVIKNEHQHTKRIQVQTGIVKDSLVEVFGGLAPGDKVLVKGSEEIKEGGKIQ